MVVRRCGSSSLSLADKLDLQIVGASTCVEQFANQYENLAATAKKIQAHSTGLSEEARDNVQQFVGDLAWDRGLLDKAVTILAHAMLASSILHSEQPADKSTWPKVCKSCLSYIKNVLAMPLERLDDKLYSALHPAAVASKAAKASSKSTSAVAAASSSSYSAAASKAHGAPLKRLKTFAKK